MIKKGLGNKANISFDFENLGSEDVTIKIGNIADSNYQPITQYRFTTPYVTSYPVGRTYGFTVNGRSYSANTPRDWTPEQMASGLSGLGLGDTWEVDSSSTNGNVFYVNSNANVYTQLQLD